MELTNDVLRAITEYAFNTALDILEDSPQYMSENAARKKYKGLLTDWVQSKLITPIPTENGKHNVYPKRRLVQLYSMVCSGKI